MAPWLLLCGAGRLGFRGLGFREGVSLAGFGLLGFGVEGLGEFLGFVGLGFGGV